MSEPELRSTRRKKGIGDSRGQTGPLAVILVFALVITGSTLVVVTGGQAITDTQNRLDVERASNTMTQLDSQAAMVAIGDSKTQQIPLDSESIEGFSVENESGWMNVSYQNTATRDVTTIYNESMGAIVYRSGTESIAYQGGGVWRADGDRSVMVSPPEFHYRDATLTLPMVQVSGDRSLTRRATITRNSTTRFYPNKSINANFVNPLVSGKVNVTVGGPYYRAWGSYFEQRTDGEVTYQHSENRVTASLTVPVGERRVKEAVHASSSSGTITFKGSTDPSIDAYTSANGDGYAGEGKDNGWNNATLTTAGDVDVQDNGVQIYGNISAGGSVDMKDWSNNFHGQRVEYGTSINPSPPAGVETEQISETPDTSKIDGPINERVDHIRKNRDGDSDYSGDTITSSATIGEESPGGTMFYVDHIDLGSTDTLTVDATDGNVSIAVRDYVRLDQGTIEVVGDHPVRFYIKGENSLSSFSPSATSNSVEPNLLVEGGTVHTGGDENSTQVWFYGKSDFGAASVHNSGDSKIVGVIYAPGSDSEMIMRKSEVYGGIVTNEIEILDDGVIHYDKALENTRAVPEAARTTKVTYLHISVNRVNVTS
jgi:hypothetical protein